MNSSRTKIGDEYYIYGLYASDDATIRYVGQTKNMSKRLYQHISRRNDKNTHKNIWIKKCLKNGNTILIKEIEKCNKNNWEEREMYWIEKLKNVNKLTNHAKGGIGGTAIQYKLSYKKLKNYINNNYSNIKTAKQYREFFKKNSCKYIPHKPEDSYKHRGWTTWSNFLNTSNIHSGKKAATYISYSQAKKIVKKHNLKNSLLYYKFVKDNLSLNIPPRPDIIYRNTGWINWGTYLGHNKISKHVQNKNYLSFVQAKEWIKINAPHIKSCRQYKRFQSSDARTYLLPTKPERTYKQLGWVSWMDFLDY